MNWKDRRLQAEDPGIWNQGVQFGNRQAGEEGPDRSIADEIFDVDF